MDNKNSVVKKQGPKPTKTPTQQPLEVNPQGQSGPEIWDGNSAGWTLVTNGRKRKNKK
jgi:hypothetical protein